MLRIKDNVELKELEKFGFKEISVDGEIIAYVKSFKYPCYNSIDVYTSNREIRFSYKPNLDTIYDLIKADIVEKIEEPIDEEWMMI